MDHFITYLLHYTVARTVYTALVSVGVGPWVLAGAALITLVLLRRSSRRGRLHTRRVYRDELARQRARRRAAREREREAGRG